MRGYTQSIGGVKMNRHWQSSKVADLYQPQNYILLDDRLDLGAPGESIGIFDPTGSKRDRDIIPTGIPKSRKKIRSIQNEEKYIGFRDLRAYSNNGLFGYNHNAYPFKVIPNQSDDCNGILYSDGSYKLYDNIIFSGSNQFRLSVCCSGFCAKDNMTIDDYWNTVNVYKNDESIGYLEDVMPCNIQSDYREGDLYDIFIPFSDYVQKRCEYGELNSNVYESHSGKIVSRSGAYGVNTHFTYNNNFLDDINIASDITYRMPYHYNYGTGNTGIFEVDVENSSYGGGPLFLLKFSLLKTIPTPENAPSGYGYGQLNFKLDKGIQYGIKIHDEAYYVNESYPPSKYWYYADIYYTISLGANYGAPENF